MSKPRYAYVKPALQAIALAAVFTSIGCGPCRTEPALAITRVVGDNRETTSAAEVACSDVSFRNPNERAGTAVNAAWRGTPRDGSTLEFVIKSPGNTFAKFSMKQEDGRLKFYKGTTQIGNPSALLGSNTTRDIDPNAEHEISVRAEPDNSRFRLLVKTGTEALYESVSFTPETTAGTNPLVGTQLFVKPMPSEECAEDVKYSMQNVVLTECCTQQMRDVCTGGAGGAGG